MIDLHSHILPELDDGAGSFRDALEMARLACRSGVRAMVATPHCVTGGAREVQLVARLLQEELQAEQIPLRLYVGMEIFGTADTLPLLQSGRLLTLNGSRYPLVEFSFTSDGEEETAILQALTLAGYIPVVAHPERYVFLQEEPELIDRWYRMGCLFQVNKGSLTGRFGPDAQGLGRALVGRGFAAAVASDAHSARVRTPWMADTARLLADEYGPGVCRRLLREAPRRILQDERLLPATPAWFE